MMNKINSIVSLFAVMACPLNFYYSMPEANLHLAYLRMQQTSILENDYQSFMNQIQHDPSVVNCIEIDKSILSGALDSNQNQCPFLDVAQILIEKGAKISDSNQTLVNTPLYQAVRTYGLIYGKPDPIVLKRDDCYALAPKKAFEDLIHLLISKSSRENGKLKYEKQIREAAHENQVDDLLLSL